MSIVRTQSREISIWMIYRFLFQLMHQYQTEHLFRVSKSLQVARTVFDCGGPEVQVS